MSMLAAPTGPTVADHRVWHAALDELEHTLDAAWMAIGREDLDAALVAMHDFEPSYLTDLPAALAGRANELVRRVDDLVRVFAAAKTDVERELAKSARLTTTATGPSHPRYIDQRA